MSTKLQQESGINLFIVTDNVDAKTFCHQKKKP